jgi:hypothetical protein
MSMTHFERKKWINEIAHINKTINQNMTKALTKKTNMAGE